MKTLILLTLLAGLGITACHSPTAPQTAQDWSSCRFVSFDVPADCGGPRGPSQPAQVALDSVSVSPTVVHAGDHFTASARATIVNCSGIGIFEVDYANYAYNLYPPSYTVSLTAALGQTVVTFQAGCGAGGPVATRTVTIQVLPA